MKKGVRFFIVAMVLFTALPRAVFAHPKPVSYSPGNGSVVPLAPKEIKLVLTEEVDFQTSMLSVVGASGEIVTLPLDTTEPDAHVLRAVAPALAQGSHTVAWHAVSKDDGHITKGTFSFSIGAPTEGYGPAGVFELSDSSAKLEALMSWLELVGEAILLAIAVLLVVGFVRREEHGSVFDKLVAFAAAFVVLGVVGYAFLKTQELAAFSDAPWSTVFSAFVATLPGAYALARLVLAGMFAAVYFSRRMKNETVRRGMLVALALGMELARARVSHAAASDFYPALSVFINAIHLVFKDLWIGTAILLAFFSEIPAELRIRARKLFAVSFMIGGISGAYVVWLHLRDTAYILTTEWGILFVWMSVMGGALFALRMFQEVIRPSRTALIAEAGAGVTLLAITALIIITTPPIDFLADYAPMIAGGAPIDRANLLVPIIALSSVGIIAFGAVWYRGHLARWRTTERSEPRAIEHGVFGFAAMILVLYTISPIVRSPFEYSCVAAGHTWQVASPMAHGKQVLATALPGCSTQGYHFAVRQEYELFKRPASSTAVWVSGGSLPLAGLPFDVSFEIQDEAGQRVTYLPYVHGAPMHVALISKDFRSFAHTHARAGAKGFFDTRLTFPAAGEYTVALDYLHRTTPTVKLLPARAAGLRTNPFLPDWRSKTQFIGPFGISLSHGEIRAGVPASLTYAITNKGEPVHDFEPYYEALMHLFAVREDHTQVVHGHVPLVAHAPVSGGHGHGRAAPVVEEHTGNLEGDITFPTSGTYHVYGEFKVGGEVIASHFIVDAR